MRLYYTQTKIAPIHLLYSTYVRTEFQQTGCSYGITVYLKYSGKFGTVLFVPGNLVARRIIFSQ